MNRFVDVALTAMPECQCAEHHLSGLDCGWYVRVVEAVWHALVATILDGISEGWDSFGHGLGEVLSHNTPNLSFVVIRNNVGAFVMSKIKSKSKHQNKNTQRGMRRY